MPYIDTRDLVPELDKLEAEPLDSLTHLEHSWLETLRELADDLGEAFRHGVTLIPEDEFENYARDFAEDIGAINDDTRWPCTYIDWKRAARELATDYTLITFDGVDYYASL